MERQREGGRRRKKEGRVRLTLWVVGGGSKPHRAFIKNEYAPEHAISAFCLAGHRYSVNILMNVIVYGVRISTYGS